MKTTQISLLQSFFILTLSGICLTPFGLVTMLTKEMNQYAWMVICVSFLFMLGNTFVMLKLAARHPNETIAEWMPHYLGKWLSSVYIVAASIVMWVWGLLMFRQHWDLTVYTLLPATSPILPVLLTVPILIYLLLHGVEAWSRFCQFFGPVLLAGLVFINATIFPRADFSRLLPLNAFPVDHIGSYSVASMYIFRAEFCLYFLYPFVHKRGKLVPVTVLSLSIAFLAVLFSVLYPAAIFGVTIAGEFVFAYQEAFETVSFATLPIEKVSFLAPLLWQLIGFYVMLVSFFCAMTGIRFAFRLNKEAPIYGVLGLFSIPLLLVRIPEVGNEFLLRYWSYCGLIIFCLVPLCVWLGSGLKRRMTHESAS